MPLKKASESERRQIQIQIASKPSIDHKPSFNFTKPYIKNKNVLDVGCWSGQYEMLAKDYVKNIVGIDPGKEAIKFANKNLSKYKNITFRVGRAEKLEFSNNSFDTVVMLAVLEHLPINSEKKALEEIYRVLKPNGYLILSTPSKNIFSILLDPAYFLIGHRHYSLKQLSDFLNKTSFKINKVRYIGGFAHLITHNIEMICKHVFKRIFNRPKWLRRRIENEFKNRGFSEIIVAAQKIS